VKERVYAILSQNTSLNFMNNRRKPSRNDFNQYYCLLKQNLEEESFTNVELFNELAVYFSDNSILISDRFKVSELAKRVWKDFYSHQNVLYPFAPIDNIAYPLTPQKEDDGYVHSFIKNDLEDIIKNKFTGNKKDYLLKILDCEDDNDLEKVYKDLPNDIKLLVKNLFDSHNAIDEYIIYKFIYDLVIDHFKIDLSDLRKKSYLDWAYKINPSVESRIKSIHDNLINNHLKVSVQNRNNKLLEYAEELWDNKGKR
jgi:hypothetical protein